MRSLAILPLLCAAACTLVQLAHAKCDLSGARRDEDFPDIEKYGVESFQMTVEYTLPKLQQSNYYVEYYDLVERQGRVDAHQAGASSSYIYKTQTTEAWEVSGRTCSLQNVTETPSMMKGDMTDWRYVDVEDDEKRTFGPSAMFKNAMDVWKSEPKERKNKMAYMGEYEGRVRGLKAVYWRRCHPNDDSYIDYFFTTTEEKDPMGTDLKKIPLRVYFGGKQDGMSEETSFQQYEIVTLQPFISKDVYPFELPKSIGCKRGFLKDAPTLPDFADTNLQFGAEVIYRKVDFSNEDVDYWSYYSTLSMAFDIESQHIAYYYSKWNSTKPEAKEEPTVLFPEYVVYDMKHEYAYKTVLKTGTCSIIREKSFYPMYRLPNNAGEIALTDPTILFPLKGMTFLTKGINRGLKVNIFEQIVENFILNNVTEITVPKAIITHSYLRDDVVDRNSVSVKNALVQIQVRLLGRQEKAIELLTFNFYNFDTEVKRRRFIFDIQRCFKNDDDYLWVTIGFNADDDQLAIVRDNIPSIQANILNSLDSTSELNPVRVPTILVDVQEGLYVTLLILGKPPILQDYLEPEKGKTLKGASDVDGVEDVETCANNCLEQEDNCWAFSFCGAVCTYANENSKVVSEKGCELYRRYNNETFLQSKELIVQNIRREVETKELKLVLRGIGDDIIQLEPSFIEVVEPGEDDRMINRIGNKPNPRMRVVKAGAKLKATTGNPVKNLGNLGFDECQRVCLDYKDCETASYCVNGGECLVTPKFGEDIEKDGMENNNLCIVVTRKYADLFNRSPGNVLSVTAQEVLKLDSVEKCARACHKSSGYDCLSFDHCPQSKDTPCKLHTVHYPNSKTREKVQARDTNCGHYYKKFSTEFKKFPNKRYLGSTIPPLTNATLEECSKACMEYKKGTCFGFDFCQDGYMMATSCILLDKEMSQLKSSSSDVCTNFMRSDAQSAPKPYSNSYAGGIGFLCFVIGLAVGALVLFGIAYIRVNRH